MSDNSIGGSIFCFLSLVCMYFYWVKEHSYIFKWRTLGALVLPVLFRFSVSAVEDYLNLRVNLLVIIPLEITVFILLWILMMYSFKYFASIGRFLPVPSACKGCKYYHGMNIICAVHPRGPVDNTCNDYQF
jgi:hypothetical protein